MTLVKHLGKLIELSDEAAAALIVGGMAEAATDEDANLARHTGMVILEINDQHIEVVRAKEG